MYIGQITLFFLSFINIQYIYFQYKDIFQSIKIIQSAKILLLSPKYEIIIVPSNHSNFAILDFSLLPLKVITLNPLCFFFDGSLSKVIALPTIARAFSLSFALKGDSEKINVT